jgi:hypothetical protein
MPDEERSIANARHNCMEWAMQTAVRGEDAMAILARAELYEEWLLKGLFSGLPFLRGQISIPDVLKR